MTSLERRSQALSDAAAAVAAAVEGLHTERDALDPDDPGTPDQEARIDAALADAQRRSDAVSGEQALLDGAPAAETTDDAAELTLLAWLADRPDLGAAVETDPVPPALGVSPPLTPAAAAAVLAALPRARPGPRTSRAVRAAAGSDEAFDELIALAVRRRLEAPEADRPVLTRDVAVLLPVRLETLFRQADDGWTMLLRIVPDEASVRRDDPIPIPLEVTLLAAMWQDVYDALDAAGRARRPEQWLRSDAARTAWEVLCRQVGPSRAAWLAGAFAPTVTDDVVNVEAPAADHPSPANRVGGFPETIEIWCAFAGSEPALLATTTVDLSALEFDVVGGRAEADGTVREQADRWWVSWPAAKDVGLGLEIALADGHGPDDIAVLYAIGLTDENPAEHFKAQIDAGELGRMTLGEPTNAVDGGHAASLGHDAEDWRHVAADRQAGRDDRELGRALTGTAAALPAVPGGAGLEQLDQALVRALWPALWGHHLRDVWGFGEEADRLGAWAADHLRPEGPLPPVRIAEQPYGLLPASGMGRWRPAPEEGTEASCEAHMLPTLLALREAAAAAANGRGTAVGADTAGLLELLGRDALSSGYMHRMFLPTQLWAALYAATTGVRADEFAETVRQVFAPAEALFGRSADREYLGADADALSIGLVVPRTWPEWYWEPGRLDEHGNPVPAMSVEDGLARLLELLVQSDFFPYDLAREQWREVLPDSLLIRLLIYAWLRSASAVVQVNAGAPTSLLEPPVEKTTVPTRLRALGQAWTPGAADDHPAGFVRRLFRDGLERLYDPFRQDPKPPELTAQLERALRATLDTATHRVDPWLVGMASRRLNYLAAQPDTRFRLGVYGWVDGPMLGAPGPTTGGLLHAPSHAQALTAVILRDKLISDRLVDPGGRDLWSMQLDSDRIRLAVELAEEVRVGAHLYEVVGRQVERIVGSRDGVRALRSAFPMRAAQAEAGRVCSGVEAMTALLSAAPPLPVTPDQSARLEALRDALDAYGDLLVTEAVHQVVTGRADLAGAAMDAAAGLAGPPTLAFTETPLSGEGLTSAVLSAVPFVAMDAADGRSPALLADASVAAAVDDATGPAESWTWTSAGGAVVTLADLGLEPVDALVLSPDLLADLASFRLGEDAVSGDGPRRHRRARDLVRALGTQPALASDLARTDPTDDVAGVAALDVAILAELRERYVALRDEAQRTIDALAAAGAREADVPSQVAALRRALRWGITPMLGKTEKRAFFEALLDGGAPADAALLPSLAARAAEALGARLKAAPAIDAREPIGRSIAELAAPEGQLAVLAQLPLADLVAVSGLDLTPDAALDDAWLPVVAAVRPHLSRLEALQLEALVDDTAGFAAVSSAPGDPWRTTALAELLGRRGEPGGDPRSSLPRFVAAYGLGDVWAVGADAVLAVGLVDSWSEAVPRTRQTTTAAFGFNAPAARAPQAILIAVPPDLEAAYGVRADTTGLIEVLVDTRELAHARAARAEDLGGILAGVPTTMLQGTGDTGVKLSGAKF